VQQARAVMIPSLTLPGGGQIPLLGLGTWRMGELAAQKRSEIAVLQHAIAQGIRLIDTAEMYGEGGAEEMLGEALAGRRDEAFVVSKVYPHNAGAKSTVAACERSLRRLKSDRLDLYLLHWRGRIPLAETLEAFERLRKAGKILRWGVSNFDPDDLDELGALPSGGHCVANQVMYHLAERGVEWRLVRQCRQAGMAVMAYSPLGLGKLAGNRRLAAIAQAAGATPVAVALAWLLAQPGVIAIPKSTVPAHLREIRRAADLAVSAATRAALDAAFPPPSRATPLAIS
jgi:diketogulonate reductase-like aldo/keto reductase